VGTTIATGDQSGNDVAAGGGRPLWPALFITDLTVNGQTSRAGDWQQGGTGIAPTRVCGVWKGAVRTVDNTANPPTVSVTPDQDPAKNNWTLGAGSDDPPIGLSNEGYGAECSWSISSLGLINGHSYRLQFMVHDGDQNKSGGDSGEACTAAIITGGGVLPVAVEDVTQLYRPTPNPFAESVRFAYVVSGHSDQRVAINVFDISGRRVRTLVKGSQAPGRHEASWDGRSDRGTVLMNGVYFVRVSLGAEEKELRIIYMR
jgi:hypothetical protein